MKEPKTFIVGAETYTVQPYLTSHGMKLLVEIFNLLGESAVTLAFQVKDKVKDGGAKAFLEMDVDVQAISAMMNGFASRAKPEVVDALFKKILVGTLIGTTSQSAAEQYDVHFQGRYGHLFKVVGKTLGAQYGDFLGALGDLVPRGAALMKAPSPSQTTSAGKSGASG